MHTHCPECQSKLLPGLCGTFHCPNGHRPYCQTCGAPEVLAPGLDYYCNSDECPDNQLPPVEKLRKLFASSPQRVEPMPYPGVAIGVVVMKRDNEYRPTSKKYVLLGKRTGPLGTGMYSLPGGKVDFGETPYDAAKREVKEETNLEFKSLNFSGHVTNDYFPDKGKQYLNMFYIGETSNPESLTIMEPDKIESWDWYDIDADLPQPMWMHTGKFLEYLRYNGYFTTKDINGKEWHP